MSSGPAIPSSTMRMASRPRATPSRDVAKPGESKTSTASLPSERAKSSARDSVSREVSLPRTISTSGIAATGLKKWMPMTRSRRPVAWAIFVIESEEVLVASRVREGQRSSSSEKIMRFKSSASGTASIAMSTLDPSFSLSTARRRCRACSAAPEVSLPLSMARPQEDSMCPRTARCASGSASKTAVSWPARAQAPAMPRPMVPAPMTRTEATERNYMELSNTRAAFPQRIRSFASGEIGSDRKSSTLRFIEATPGLG